MGYGRATSVGLHLLSGLIGSHAPGTDRPHLRIAGTRRRSPPPPPMETGELEAGAARDVMLKLAPGHYALICALPGHSLGGMYANFGVK